MNRQVVLGTVLTGILSVFVAILTNIISGLYQPKTSEEKLITAALLLLFVIISLLVTIYLQYEPKSTSKLLINAKRYSSFWLLSLAIAIVNVVAYLISLVNIVILSSSILIVVSIFAYMIELRHKSDDIRFKSKFMIPKKATYPKPVPSPYTFNEDFNFPANRDIQNPSTEEEGRK
jgi:hypothetical protein